MKRWIVCLAMLAGMAAVPAFAADSSLPARDLPATLQLRDLQGRMRDLGEFRGKVVLVNFWASWCEPCRDEMPELENLRQKYADKGLEIVAVNLAESGKRIQSFLNAFMPDGVSLIILLDRNSLVYKQWQVHALPTSFLIDRNGLIRWHSLGELDLTDAETIQRIEELLN